MTDTAQTIFAQSGGQLSFSAQLSLAAYRLASTETVGDGINLVNSSSNAAFTDVASKLLMLTATDLPALTPAPSGNASFPTNGINGGIYTHGNAAAIVGRSSDALFLTFRGTNDTAGLGNILFGTPDNNQWSDPAAHYTEFAQLISAIETYIADPANSISKVYVSGHSLGGAMAQEFMRTHAGALYEAVTFASIGTDLPGGAGIADARETNLWINNDAARLRFALTHEDLGDNNFADVGLNFTNASSIHSIKFYGALAQFLEANGVTLSSLQSQNGVNVDSLLMQVSEFSPDTGVFIFGANDDTLVGIGVAEILLGGDGSDSLFGNAGRDQLFGGDGTDRLSGGLDKDILNGGSGADRFDFNTVKEAGRTASTRDIIQDMTRGSDRIDFKDIDAKADTFSNEKFKWIGARDFSDHAGELHIIKKSGFVFVEGDTNGDGRADFRIVVEHVSSLGKADFIL